MASLVPGRLKPAICAEKQRLTDALLKATRDVVALHDREMVELVRGEIGLDRFDLALTLARKRRDAAKRALVLHNEEHG